MLSVAAVIGRDFDLDLLARATNTAEDDLLDILDAAAAVSLVRELADTPGRYSFAHALIQHTLYEDLGATRRARAHRARGRSPRGTVRGPPGRAGGRAGPALVQRHPADRPDQGHRLLPPGRRCRAGRARPPTRHSGTTSRPRALRPGRAVDPTQVLDLAIGLGMAQRQTGDPGFRTTLLAAARRAAELGDTERLVAAALANNRGMGLESSVRSTTRSVDARSGAGPARARPDRAGAWSWPRSARN